MEELIKILSKYYSEGIIPANFRIKKLDNGNILFEIPQKSKIIEKIRKEIDDIDEDIFIEVSQKFKKSYPKEFEILGKIDEEFVDEKSTLEAYTIFRRCVIEYVESLIKSHNEEVNRLYNKYLNK